MNSETFSYRIFIKLTHSYLTAKVLYSLCRRTFITEPLLQAMVRSSPSHTAKRIIIYHQEIVGEHFCRYMGAHRQGTTHTAAVRQVGNARWVLLNFWHGLFGDVFVIPTCLAFPTCFSVRLTCLSSLPVSPYMFFIPLYYQKDKDKRRLQVKRDKSM